MRRVIVGTVLGLVAAAGICGAAWQPSDEPPGRQEGRTPDIAGMLMSGLQSSPGCLGVDAGRFQSGKLVIVGWFENKAAVVEWYNNPTHRQMVMRMGGNPEEGEPLAHVTDDQAPIMVIASITPAKEPMPGMAMPISQISIELYAPLPGGAFMTSRFAPETFEVPHMRELKPEGEGEGEAAPE